MRCEMSAVVQTCKSMRKGTSGNINFLTLTCFNIHTVIADVGNVVTRWELRTEEVSTFSNKGKHL
jgi:hypothetical protein